MRDMNNDAIRNAIRNAGKKMGTDLGMSLETDVDAAGPGYNRDQKSPDRGCDQT
ncbi:hypothetical protein [Microbispora sp. NBC_01389]|uniref:hypothetical protein n=1 Tax=Microbispora sp. NBC_01389 TaxID=2903584 RepID=UPI003246C5B7